MNIRHTVLIIGIFIAMVGIMMIPYERPPLPLPLGPVQSGSPVNNATSITPLVYGRWKRPLSSIIPIDTLIASTYTWPWSSLSSYISFKRWHYISVTTDQLFIGVAIVHLSYVANAFVYIVDKATGIRYEHTKLSPLATNIITWAPSPLTDCSEWHSGGLSICICYQPAIRAYTLKAHGVLHNGNHTKLFNANLYVNDNIDHLSLLYPISVQQPAYTDKISGTSAYGTLKLGSITDYTHATTPSFTAVSDWTYSVAARITIWKWLSFAANVIDDDGRVTLLGINLSDDVYNDVNGVSQENGIWIDGTLVEVGGIIWQLPQTDRLAHDMWTIHTNDTSLPVQFTFSFQPLGAREEHINAIVIASDFVQPYGIFNGTMTYTTTGTVASTSASSSSSPAPAVTITRTWRINNVFGVCENHYAKW